MADTQQDLAYDLRQKYAEIVGLHLEEVTKARVEKDYPTYFKALENLFTVVKHKFKTKKTSSEDLDYDYSYDEEEGEDKKPKKKGKDKTEKKTDLERYRSLKENAISIANKYESAFLGSTDDPDEISKIENSLREIEMFLFYVMDKAKMFGSVGYNEGM